MTVELPAILTMTGAARRLNVCTETIRRRVEGGLIKPDFVLVESEGRPGSLIFKAERLPEIAAVLATNPK